MGSKRPEDEWKFKCAQTGGALRRKKRYYRNGKYFLNKGAYLAYVKKQEEEKAKAAEEAKAS